MNNKFLMTAKIAIPAVLMLFLSGCLKNHSGFTDFTQTSDFVILTGAGTGNFKASNVSFATGDTVTKTITVNLASATDDNGHITVTIGVDNTVIAPYNSANGTNFQPFPAGTFKLLSNKVDIAAGQHYGTTTVQIFGDSLDPAVSYMLPISITDGGGKTLSSNQNTIYYNVIGNAMAGIYTFTGYRWNAATGLDTTMPPASIPYNNVSIAAGPINSTTLLMPDAYLSQNAIPAGTALSFTNNAGVVSNIQVSSYDPQAAITGAGFSIVTGPVLVGYNLVGDASTKYVGSTFRIYYVFFNGSANRAIIDNFVKTQ